MPTPRTQALIDALKAWCGAEHGRGAETAARLGVSRQTLSNWLSGRNQPTAEQILEVQAFLKGKKSTTR